MGDAYADGGLSAPVLVDLDQVGVPLDIGSRKARGDDFFDPLILLHVPRQNRIEYIVGRQTVLIGLVRAELR